MAAARKAKSRRHSELARIHIGANALVGDDRDAYRDMLEAVAGVRSAKDLDEAGRRKVLKHLQSCGARVGPGPSGPGRPRITPREGLKPLLKKIDALSINHPGGRKPREWAEGALQQMTGSPDRTPLEWATEIQLRKLIQAIEVDVRRRKARAS